MRPTISSSLFTLVVFILSELWDGTLSFVLFSPKIIEPVKKESYLLSPSIAFSLKRVYCETREINLREKR